MSKGILDVDFGDEEDDADEDYKAESGSDDSEDEQGGADAEDDEEGGKGKKKGRGKGTGKKAKAPQKLRAKKSFLKTKVTSVGQKVLEDDDDIMKPEPVHAPPPAADEKDKDKAVNEGDGDEGGDAEADGSGNSKSRGKKGVTDADGGKAEKANSDVDAMFAMLTGGGSATASTSASKAPASSAADKQPATKRKAESESVGVGMGSLISVAKKPKKAKGLDPSVAAWLSEPAKPVVEAEDSSASSSSAASSSSGSSSSSVVHEQTYLVEETKSYAGRAVKVTRVITKGSEEDKQLRAAKKKRDALDDVLNELKPEEQLNTVEKSKYDWELNKHLEGDAHELEQKAKNGLLGKRDFLAEVDVRTYEIDRAKRLAGKRFAANPVSLT